MVLRSPDERHMIARQAETKVMTVSMQTLPTPASPAAVLAGAQLSGAATTPSSPPLRLSGGGTMNMSLSPSAATASLAVL